MIITGSNIGMDSARNFTSVRTEVRNFKAVMVKQEQVANRSEAEALEEIRKRCMNYLLKWLFGLSDKEVSERRLAAYGSGLNRVQYTFTEEVYYREQEETTFSAEGKIICADGRELSLSMEIGMSRSFETAYTGTFELAQCVDPLIINLDCDIADIGDQKFYFDLDCDGEEDEISMPGAGSGFLALDRNGNGTLDDGSELFGTKSGNGFRDLARFDADGNGWIDEADEIFAQLRIVTFDEEGNQKLYSLKEKGLGALYLGSAPTEFSLNRLSDNKTNAYIRRTGLFLYENGQAGSLQQIDLTKPVSLLQ